MNIPEPTDPHAVVMRAVRHARTHTDLRQRLEAAVAEATGHIAAAKAAEDLGLCRAWIAHRDALGCGLAGSVFGYLRGQEDGMAQANQSAEKPPRYTGVSVVREGRMVTV